MHICFLTHEYPKPGLNPGGVGVFLQTFCNALVNAGHQVTVLGVNNISQTEDSTDNNLRVIRFAQPSVKGLNWFLIGKKLNAYLKEIHVQHPLDIVEGSELALAFISKKPGINYVIRMHGGHHFFAESENRGVNPWKAFQEKRSFAKADAFIAVSDYVRNHTAKFLSIKSKPIQTIRYLIDHEKFPYQAYYSEAEEFSLVFVGTICEKKGVGNLVEAMKKVIKVFPKTSLSIYGKDWFFPDGTSYTTYLKSKISAEIKDRIHIYPPVAHEEIPGIYAKAEVCVFPSFMETQGLVAPEAMFMGKVVIFTDKGPGPETIDHLVNGFLCNPLSVDHIADTIILALENRDKFQKIGEKALEKAHKMFHISSVLEKNLQFYHSLALYE
ncbi:glycosyltransferase family 4 protein [Algoriphagus persicinus]|uniref:glycosyltransferase family 4 protein n=1 Tax=Algoriphagus persicinus TaxID=3108754 RepID=UPI002B3B1A54|nr:glycosyltransferase family 4 protein [Algoriphagus sp. E1-3-M2]MEB2785138.1 glycosyltransferase family 4 protein [Algoriphagus sp. E1-3-M2]